MAKMVVYKSLDDYCVTTLANYNSYVQNTRTIQRLQGFTSFQEVIEYYCKYFNAKEEDFVVIRN